MYHQMRKHLGQLGEPLPLVISAGLGDQRESRTSCIPFGCSGRCAIGCGAVEIETQASLAIRPDVLRYGSLSPVGTPRERSG